MPGRTGVLLLLSLALSTGGASVTPPGATGSGAVTRRAVLVGIDVYVDARSGLGSNAVAMRGLGNLEGPVNDVESVHALLVGRFGFRAGDIRVLTDAAATREAILGAIRDHLGRGAPGDAAVFFFAGHGSWVENSGSSEADGRDETLVPVDAAAGVPDIRDKELRVLFAALLDRGIDLTVIVDACHSGSITRGVEPARDRSVRPAPMDVADGATYPPPPGDHPSGRALVLSAAEDRQKAREFRTEDGHVSGAFTWALVEALRTAPRGVPAAFLFQQAGALMKGRGFEQDPVIDGSGARREEPLFPGDMDDRYSGTVVPIAEIESATALVLHGGPASGLRPGSELVTLRRDDLRVPARVRVTESLGLARSRAVLVAGELRGLSAGDLFVVGRWAAEPAGALAFGIPPPIVDAEEAEAVYRMAKLLQSEVRWVDDPTRVTPTHLLEWSGRSWRIRMTGGPAMDLGQEPTLDDLRAALAALAGAGHPRLFVALPPSNRLADALGREFSRIGPAAVLRDAGADFRLVGTLVQGERRYFWMHVRAASSEGSGGLPPTTEPVPDSDRGSALGFQARRLIRAWGWLSLVPPDGGAFPYRVTGFERTDGGSRSGLGDTLRWGERYRAILEAPRSVLERVVSAAYGGGTARWYWYLFAMDREGTGTLLFPRVPSDEHRVDLLAPDAGSRVRIVVPGGSSYLFSPVPSKPAVGSDFATLFLLASAEPLPDPPQVLNFTGVGSRADDDGGVTEPGTLSRLLFEIGNGSRGGGLSAPAEWALQRVPVLSAPDR